MVYFGLPALGTRWGLGLNFDKLTAAVLTLSLNSAAYGAEIVRGSIQSIESGQWEAAKSLGLSPRQTLRHVIFPQALRRMVPPLGNEFITLLKNTSLVAVIGYQELLREGQLIVARTYRSFEIYFAVTLIYLSLSSLASHGFTWLEYYLDPIRGKK
jgi:arginine/lysine/histidine/glutamine transport system substrate-binding/permease protein